MNNTPLRYPGGKSIMATFFRDLFKHNSLKDVVYAEPYAGGAGTAINLLLNGDVERIMINDASVGVYSFWSNLVHHGEEMIHLVETTEVNLDEWKQRRKVFKNAKEPSLELGFATFFLSRTNRSGILHAGPMGGQDPEKQKIANYKLDCRFNKADLLSRMKRIIALKDRISVSNLDAIDFLKSINGDNTFVYLDPPYYVQGSGLYMNYYKHDNHVELADFITKSKFNWVLSYDNVPEIRVMYADRDLFQFNLTYTAQDVKSGSELLTCSDGISLPEVMEIRRKAKNIPIVPLAL